MSSSQEERPASMTTNQLRLATIVSLSTPLYLICWWLVLGLHLVVAIFVLFASFAHFALSQHDAHVNTGALEISVTLKRIAGVSYMVVGFLHLRAGARMISASVGSRQLTLQVSSEQSAPVPTSKLHLVYHSVHERWAAVFGSNGYVGINGSLFHTALVTREFVEVTLQSYQVWVLSHSVSRAWVGTFAVVAVVLNCWTLPIGNLLFKNNEGNRRLTHLVMDMYLDFACSVVVPVCILVPYFLQYDWRRNEFTLRDDVWKVNAVAEARYVLVASYVDFCSSLLPQYSIFSCLGLLKRLVHRTPRPKVHDHAARSANGDESTSMVLMSSKRPLRRRSSSIRDILGEHSSIALGNGSRSLRLATATMALWGVFIAFAHIEAQTTSTVDASAGCLLYMKPWFAINATCAVLSINCHRGGIIGSADEIATILDQLERDVLARIIVSYCPALAIPHNLQQFPGLGGFIIVHSNLTSWPRDAAITKSTHPSMHFLQIGNTIMNKLPPGLYHPELPSSLITVSISNCSLDTLPEDIGDVWKSAGIQQFYLENTLVRTIPASLRLIPVRVLSLTGKLVEELPEDLFATSSMFSIRLSGNPLKRLPSKMGDTSALDELFVEYTNVSTLPDWTVSWLQDYSTLKSFYGSPLCGPDFQDDESWKICEKDSQSRDGVYSYAFLKAMYPQ